VSSIDLLVRILGDSSSLTKELGNAESGTKGLGGSISGALSGGIGKVAALAGGIGIAAVAISDLTNAAAEDQAEQARFEAAIKASGAAVGDYQTVLDASMQTAQDKAFTDTQAREALTSLTTATGDATAAAALMGPAMDIARFANVDLATAADAVAKAQAGQDGALTKLMPGLEKGATAADTLAAATKGAAGSADAYANSAQGMQDSAGNAFGELTETIGSVFLPVLQAILPALIPLLKAFGTLVEALLPLIIPLVTRLGTALGIVANVLTTVVGWLVKLVTWLGNAMSAVGDFLAKINPFKDIKLPSLPFLNSTVVGMPAAVAFGGDFGRDVGGHASAPVGGGGINVNVFTTGDSIDAERAVTKALTRVLRMNTGLVLPTLPRTG
jgi:hypothetical protein